jgi:hypothetical protein
MVDHRTYQTFENFFFCLVTELQKHSVLVTPFLKFYDQLKCSSLVSFVTNQEIPSTRILLTTEQIIIKHTFSVVHRYNTKIKGI